MHKPIDRHDEANSLFSKHYKNRLKISYIEKPTQKPGISVGIAIGYGLDGPGIESRWGEIICTCSDRPWGPPSLLYNGYRVYPGAESGRDVTLTLHPLLVPRSKNRVQV
jgi:hypothetical protein